MTKPKIVYGVHPGVKTMQDWVATLKEKTGRSLEEWLALVKKSGPAQEAARRDWLKKRHGLGTNSAWWIAERSVGKGMEDSDPAAYLKAAAGWVEGMFSGKRAALRPAYERLLEVSYALGGDVRACPCKTIVPLYRRHVFAQIKPATNTRIDFGLALKDAKPAGRLVSTGGLAKGDRITHRIAVSTPEDVDGELLRWLKKAYARDA